MALHDFFDPPSPEDEEQTQRALEAIALSVLRF
jgi:hypothetical protein